MPERVVDALEVVEVEAQHRQALAPLHALELVVQPLAQHQAIGQVGQRVVARHVHDALLSALPVGDVLVGGDPAAAGDRDCARWRRTRPSTDLTTPWRSCPPATSSSRLDDVVGRAAREGPDRRPVLEQIAQRAARRHHHRARARTSRCSADCRKTSRASAHRTSARPGTCC